MLAVFSSCSTDQNPDIAISSTILENKWEIWRTKTVEIAFKSLQRVHLPYNFVLDKVAVSSFADSVEILGINLQGINKFDDRFYNFKNVTTLTIEKINTDSIIIDFAQFNKLYELFYSMENGSNLFDDEFVVPSVKIVDIVGCPTLKSIDKGINGFCNLTTLHFKNLPYRTVYNFSFADLDSLEYLELLGCNLDSFPGDLLSNNTITHLILTNNNLQYLPDSITKMKRLKFITLHKNKFITKPILPDKYWIVMDE